MQTIRELRVARGWTQLQLAVELGTTPTTVYSWEKGRSTPSVAMLRKVAELFGVTMDSVVLVDTKKVA